jgi:hypothetical protein
MDGSWFFPPHGPVPFRTQYDGSRLQDADCGPDSMWMIARSYGLKAHLTGWQLMQRLKLVAGTTLKGGTGYAGIRRMARWLELDCVHNPDSTQERIDRQLSRRALIVALGDYYALPWHFHKNKRSGHFIVITRNEDGRYRVRDPATYERVPRFLTWPQLERFLARYDGSTFRITPPT